MMVWEHFFFCLGSDRDKFLLSTYFGTRIERQEDDTQNTAGHVQSMPLYFTHGVTSRGVVSSELVVPHPTHPIVASAWRNPVHVLVTDAEGELIAEHDTQHHTHREKNSIASMAWHPTHPVLAMGWKGGELKSWTFRPPTKTTARFTSPRPPVDTENAAQEHGAGAVTMCVWSSGGAYLLTASPSMRVVVWKAENRTVTSQAVEENDTTTMLEVTFTLLRCVQTEVEMVRAVPAAPSLIFQELADPQGQPLMSSARDDNDECVFFLCGAGKEVFALNEDVKLLLLVTLDESAMELLYDSRDRKLVVLSVAHIINVYNVSDTLEVKPFLRRKLSTPSAAVTTERFIPTMQWAAPGVLAFGCGDNRVRFFDISSDRVYFVPHPALATAHITHVSTLGRKGLLAMATAEGPLAIFQWCVSDGHNAKGVDPPVGPNADDRGRHNSSSRVDFTTKSASGRSSFEDPSEQWELLTVVDIEGRVDCINFTTAGHIVVALDGGRLQILRETVRKRAWDGVVAATQISMNVVVVESVTGCQCLLKSSSKIRGLSVAFPVIGLWNGQQIDLYTVNECTSTATKTNFVSTTSPVFAVHSEGLFFVRDANRVVFTDFQFVTIGQISFTESEGTPIVIDVMGDVVVTISSKHAMRLARVSGREVRQLGPPRQLSFVDKDILVTDAKVNAQGRRVALMTRRVGSDQPDCRIWVYDCDTDQMNFYDFAARGEVPDVVYWNTPEPNSNTIGELDYLLLACETHQIKPKKAQTVCDGADAMGDETAGKILKQLQEEQQQQQPQRQQSRHGSSFVTAGKGDVKDALGEGAMPDLENFTDKEKRMEEERYMNGFSGVNPFVHRIHSVVTLFATNKGLVVHNTVELKRYHICLVGLTIPDFLLASVRINGNPRNPEDYMIEQKRLRDFEGLKTEKDAMVLEALMKFSYYYTIGNMDEAYRCVKTIKEPAVWQSLGRMCVFTGRLDVAEVCLAQMQDGVAASALREARTNYPGEKDVHLATLACSLGLVKECEELLRKAKRFDLITDLLLACGKFEQARRHVRAHDRIHTYPVAYKYAQFIESFSNFETAVLWYSNARCFSTDVARIFFQSNRLNELLDFVLPSSNRQHSTFDSGFNNGNGHENEKFSPLTGDDIDDELRVPTAVEAEPLEKSAPATTAGGGGSKPGGETDETEDLCVSFQRLFLNNKDLLLWWAQYSERRKQVSDALKFYTLAEDIFNVVRLLCAENPPRIEEAVELVDKEVEKARRRADSITEAAAVAAMGTTQSVKTEVEPVGAAYFIGLYHERADDPSAALQYYTHAGAWRAASKVAKNHQRLGDLLNISISSGDTQLMLDNAIFLEENNAYDKAVELYHRVGEVQRAIDVCIKGGLYDAMHRISTTLDAHSNHEVFLQMADHFVEGKHYSKAAEMYIFAKDFTRALELCTTRGVELTEDMAAAMSSAASGSDWTEEQRTALLRQIAGIARDQGNWNLACKNYTQVGERVKAMKMLMRSGDVNKVIFFANHSRNAEIYTLAGNFLQSQNLHSDENIYKNIVLFYTKAKAFGHLVSFIDVYAQLQIDENRNYYEAWRALDECVRLLERNRDAVYAGGSVMAKEENLRTRRDIVALVVRALKLLAESAKDETKSEELVAVCSNLIKRSRPSHQDSHVIASAIRIGDVFAMLVRHYYENVRSAKDALRVIESMVKHAVEPQFFVEQDLLEAVCVANGRKVAEFVSGGAEGNTARNRAEHRPGVEEEGV